MSTSYILIVDDHEDIRDMLTATVNYIGMEAKTAKNGKEALEMIDKEVPKAIILDLMMPVMDGFTTLTRLRAESTTANVPVILLSAISDQKSMDNLPGVTHVMRKGAISLETIRDALDSLGLL